MLSALARPEAEQGMAQVFPFPGQKIPEPVISVLEQKIRDLTSRNRLLTQLCLAYGDDNRYFASLELGRSATNNEAFLHFVSKGGKAGFDSTHPHTG